EKAHHMVDAERAAVLAVLADRLGKQPIRIQVMPFGIGWWKGPVLAVRREVVGRRTDATAGNVEVAVRPQIAAKTIGRQRQVVIKSDAQTAFFCALLHSLELRVDLPLYILMEEHAPPVLGCEVARRNRIGVTKMFGPRLPVPGIPVALVHRLVERGVYGKSMQTVAL